MSFLREQLTCENRLITLIIHLICGGWRHPKLISKYIISLHFYETIALAKRKLQLQKKRISHNTRI